MIAFEQRGCIRAKVVVFGQKGLFSGKKWFDSGSAEMFGQNSCIWVELFYSGKSPVIQAKVVVFRKKLLFSGKRFCILAKWLYSCRSCCIRARVVVFG